MANQKAKVQKGEEILQEDISRIMLKVMNALKNQ
jgi:hypothetical protein